MKQTFHADATKLDLCKIKRNWARRPTPPPNAGEEIGMVNWADVLKQVLSTRLNEEVYSGLIGVMQTLHSSVPNKQIENALVSHRNDSCEWVRDLTNGVVSLFFRRIYMDRKPTLKDHVENSDASTVISKQNSLF